MKTTLTYPNERLQLGDYEAVAKLILDEFIRLNRVALLPDGRTGGTTATPSRVFSGFTIGHVAGGTCWLHRGSGIFGFYDQGELKHGILLGEEDPDHYILDFSALPNGNYYVYVRMVFGQTDTENRIFWNASPPPAEGVDNVPTRLTPAWEYLIQAVGVAPPGHGEWVRIWGVGVAAGAITVTNPYHHIYFEGDADDNYLAEWGDGADDRNANRRLYGIADFHLFAQLVRRQLSDIIGVKHYTAVPRSLTAMAAEHKVSGAHSSVTADSVVVTGPTRFNGKTPDLAAVQVRTGTISPDAMLHQIASKVGGVIGERHLVSVDRQGVMSGPNLLLESFLYPRLINISSIPGKRWGKYYTAAAMGNFYIDRGEKIDNNLHGRKLRFDTVSGVAPVAFCGVRTGNDDNNQEENGFWAVRNQPWVTAAFLSQAWSANGGLDIGFCNDKSPFDSDPSRTYIRFDKATDSARLHVVASDGTVFIGAVNLMGLFTLDDDTVYRAKLVIIDASTVRATLYNTDLSEEVNIGAKSLSVGGVSEINYSSFIVATTTAGLVDTQTVDLYRWDTGDSAYVGGAYNLL